MKRVLVVGDVIADVYRDCTFKKMCPDAPDVKALVTRSIDVRPGGAANVAVNLAALSPDTRIHLIGGVGVELAREIKRASKSRVSMDYCSFWDDPITKERVSDESGMLMRLDNYLEVPLMFSENIEENLKQYLSENDPDLIVVSDYNAGSIDTSWDIILGARDRVLLDTKLTDLSRFGSDGLKTKLVKLNYDEWKAVTAYEAAPERFFDAMVMTRGAGGAYLSLRTDRDSKSVTHTLRVSGHRVPAVDVCGCGDTFMAGLAASLLQSDDYFSAVQFANAAAATVVTQARTAVASLGETLGLLGRGEQDEAR